MGFDLAPRTHPVEVIKEWLTDDHVKRAKNNASVAKIVRPLSPGGAQGADDDSRKDLREQTN